MPEKLKPGQVKVFQCESCGEIFDPSSDGAKYGSHTATLWMDDGQGGAEPEPCQCGPISERILADEGTVRRETIKECAEIARKQAWSHACEGFENGPELNSQAIHEAIRALAEEGLT